MFQTAHLFGTSLYLKMALACTIKTDSSKIATKKKLPYSFANTKIDARNSRI